MPSIKRNGITAEVLQLYALEVLPDPLIRVEIRCVAGQLLQLHPASRSARQKFFDRSSPMDRRTIPYDEQLSRDLAHEMLQEAHHIFSFEGTLLLQHVELAIERDATHRRKVISREVLLEDGCLSHRSIGANHHRQQIEARLVAEEYGPALLQRPFLREGHFFCFKLSMFSSSRCSARRCGLCKLCLRALSKRLT